jgi:ectoine hydroxylase-related dioxygenase (phytanoyl-CoA dioxygenase family)
MPTLSELHEPVHVGRPEIDRFKTDGFVHLKHLLSARTLATVEAAITAEVRSRMAPVVDGQEQTTYQKAFTQVMNLWTVNQVVNEFVCSPRVASAAAQLLEVASVRLYHDQALYKEKSGGYTPWHADQFYWPLATDRAVTAWIPLQDTPLEMGPLAFSAKSQLFTGGRSLPISDESEAMLDALLTQQQFDVVEKPFSLGDVSFHLGWTYHRAGPNTTDTARKVMTMIYMDAEMTLKHPENDFQRADWHAWCPGAVPGEPIRTALNPVVFSSS